MAKFNNKNWPKTLSSLIMVLNKFEIIINKQKRNKRMINYSFHSLHNLKILIGIILLFSLFIICNAQKPINLGGVKRRDVYIAGLFPFGKYVPENHIGRGVMPSVKLAVDHVNDNSNVLRNYRLHMWWNDTAVESRQSHGQKIRND